MGRKLTPEDRDIWDKVARTVSPAKPRKAERIAVTAASAQSALKAELKAPPKFVKPPRTVPAATSAKPAIGRIAQGAPDPLEPRRHRRIARERDPIEATLDLHGFGRFEAQDQVTAFLTSCQSRGLRAVLLITGQGRRGGGVIRASIHEWLQSPGLRGVVSGFAAAHRRHGGDGAIYVTLKRRG
ncbi:MAG: DNA-nicking Smr family endonuclease [Brevundimonas sp.]|uniref:Smr/MutS family protein n=1 Tax=Brevundimonas sp. TaxID=1871086 RepID=UPI0039E52CEB